MRSLYHENSAKRILREQRSQSIVCFFELDMWIFFFTYFWSFIILHIFGFNSFCYEQCWFFCYSQINILIKIMSYIVLELFSKFFSGVRINVRFHCDGNNDDFFDAISMRAESTPKTGFVFAAKKNVKLCTYSSSSAAKRFSHSTQSISMDVAFDIKITVNWRSTTTP